MGEVGEEMSTRVIEDPHTNVVDSNHTNVVDKGLTKVAEIGAAIQMFYHRTASNGKIRSDTPVVAMEMDISVIICIFGWFFDHKLLFLLLRRRLSLSPAKL